MRKIRDVLRYRHSTDLSLEAIARALNISKGVVAKYLKLAADAGLGWPLPADTPKLAVPDTKRWIEAGAYRHAAMFGIGTGLEQNTHKIGEALDTRELRHAIAFLARYPGTFAGHTG